MDTPYRPHSQWAPLSSDIWGLIFSLMNPHLNIGLCMSAPGHKQRDQASVCALQTACKKCRAAFLQHPQLQRDVLLGSNFNNSSLPNLLEWIRLHGDAVQNLGAECESQTLMASLCMQKSCLKMVSLMQLTSSILDVLTFFHTLTAFHLMPSTGETLSLQKLCRLPNLTSLELLDGSFTHLDAAAHLTWLNMFRCDALCCQDSLLASCFRFWACRRPLFRPFTTRASLLAVACRNSALTVDPLLRCKILKAWFSMSRYTLPAVYQT